MSELITYCKRHDVAVYPDAGKKYAAEFHERHKDCCQALDEMSESFTRQQVDAITAPWLDLCVERGERIKELEALIRSNRFAFVKDVPEFQEILLEASDE